MQDFNGALAFITGGASGIGLGIARALAAEGAVLALADLREDHLAQAEGVADAEGWGDRCLPLRLDVTDRAAYLAALDTAEARFGPLRVLVNNAGVGINGPIAEASFADWDWGIDVNLKGVINGLVLGLPRLRAHGQPAAVLNTASLAPFIPARPLRGVYAAAKAAVVLATEHLALDLADSPIGVSVLCPGPVTTNIHQAALLRSDTYGEASAAFRAVEAESLAAAAPEPTPLWRDPLEVGELCIKAMRERRLYVFPHPEFLPITHKRHAAIEAALEEAAQERAASGN